MPEDSEITAWHEAGHAMMAILQGGYLERVTLEPPFDDGPARYGDTVTRWSGLNPTELALAEIHVSLAGPVVEMIYTGDRVSIASVPEWAADWQRATLNAAAGSRDAQSADLLLRQSVSAIFDLFDDRNQWAAVSSIADDLLAFETLEHEQVAETIAFWQRR
ncbi:M50 family metallopeptidase [Mariniblastus sp.]|nr:M50 family metallopeptidase [Mariniblastus sp.]